MDDKERVFTAEVIEETPFPGEPIVSDILTQSSGGGNFSPNTTNDKPIKRKRQATELLSEALNTRSRNILQEFDLVASGGFKVGNFEEGISGDLRITPNGITARDVAGITTFAINGVDGSAVFKGQIQSGSLITGEVIVGNNNLIFTVDSTGQPQIILNDGTTDRVLIGYQENGF